MATPYSKVIEVFLNKITDMDLPKFDDITKDIIIIGYMKSACTKFAKVCEIDVYDRDDEIQEFNCNLDDEIIDIITENNLGIGIVFGLYNVNGLVLIDGMEAGFGQFLGNTGTQNSSAVQTQDRIDGGIIDKMGNQLVSNVLRFTQTGLLVGDINIVIDMGVIGGEVTAGNTQGNLSVADRQMGYFNH